MLTVSHEQFAVLQAFQLLVDGDARDKDSPWFGTFGAKAISQKTGTVGPRKTLDILRDLEHNGLVTREINQLWRLQPTWNREIKRDPRMIQTRR